MAGTRKSLFLKMSGGGSDVSAFHPSRTHKAGLRCPRLLRVSVAKMEAAGKESGNWSLYINLNVQYLKRADSDRSLIPRCARAQLMVLLGSRFLCAGLSPRGEDRACSPLVQRERALLLTLGCG